MRINKNTTIKRTLFTASAFAILIAVGLTAAALTKIGPFATKSDSSINLDRPSDEQIKAGNESKASTAESVLNDKGSSNGSDPLPAPTPASGPNDKATVGMSITATNQNDDKLQVRALVQTISSTGNCVISMSGPNGKTYTASSSVQAIASSTTCKGFDVPTSSLSSGSWSLVVSFENDSYTATATKAITVK